jgi:hypothetical protein
MHVSVFDWKLTCPSAEVAIVCKCILLHGVDWHSSFALGLHLKCAQFKPSDRFKLVSLSLSRQIRGWYLK